MLSSFLRLGYYVGAEIKKIQLVYVNITTFKFRNNEIWILDVYV
jgi:hypothetical protein